MPACCHPQVTTMAPPSTHLFTLTHFSLATLPTCHLVLSMACQPICHKHSWVQGWGAILSHGRALGPEVGVSIGLCFFLGNAVAGSLYVLGAVETFLDALPGAGIFGEVVTKVNGTEAAVAVPSPNLHDLQVYGIVVTIILCFIVFGGVKMINRVAPAFLIPVLFSLFCHICWGCFGKKGSPCW
ncbi:Cation-chloride cotransporter 1 [Vitis vinifera]|uniref:Cation-chloride cotransporter 1 n=1 Tax=Vitis vinifera TaxID=29760 RepID=A0A438INZ4_VITVI|nr:Cation-chloride cotransporter 1 [Vitis vinifera]